MSIEAAQAATLAAIPALTMDDEFIEMAKHIIVTREIVCMHREYYGTEQYLWRRA